MTYLQNKNAQKKGKIWIFVFIIFVTLVVSNKHLRQFASRSAATMLTPLFKVGNLSKERWSSFIFLFKDKNSLEDEIKQLVEKNIALEKEILALGPLSAENEELKSLFLRNNNKEFLLASIISKPPQSPYDVIIVDAGTDEGVEPGMRVIAYSDIIIGYVTEVFRQISKVTLISSPGEEINVFIENAKLATVSAGLGGGNMEIKIPSSISISPGDKITTAETFPLLVGTVEKIDVNLPDPFQKILFRSPINLQQIKYVTIEKK